MADLRDQLQSALGSNYTIDRELPRAACRASSSPADTALHRDVVIKVLPPDLLAGVNVERFRREILLAAGLQHPHILPVLAAGETDGVPWFTMPFVDGESLRQRLMRGPLPIAEAVAMLREIAKARGAVRAVMQLVLLFLRSAARGESEWLGDSIEEQHVPDGAVVHDIH